MNTEDCEFYSEIQHVLQENGSVKDIPNACLKDMVTVSCEGKECYYKKLQTDIDKLSLTRDKLLGDLQIAEENLKDYKEHYDKLETENEKLKPEIESMQYNLSLREDDAEFYSGSLSNLKQTLKKVKEIAEKRNYLNLDEALDDILNLFSEVQNDKR